MSRRIYTPRRRAGDREVFVVAISSLLLALIFAAAALGAQCGRVIG